MSEENVEIARQALEAWDRRDRTAELKKGKKAKASAVPLKAKEEEEEEEEKHRKFRVVGRTRFVFTKG